MLKENLSVVIRTKNEARWIGHAIQSILNLIHKPEIIIVDDNSDDETLKIIRYFSQDPVLKNNENKNYTNIKIFQIINFSFVKSFN